MKNILWPLLSAVIDFFQGLFNGNKFPKALPENIANIEEKAIDGQLKFQDVVGWFKQQSLDKGKDTPFVAIPAKFKGLLNFEPKKPEALLLGIYNEQSNSITKALIIECDETDGKTKEVLQNNELVVLS